MLQKVVLVTVGALWGLLVFVLGITLSFPSELAAERLTWEIDEATDGAWRVEADSVRPWRLSGAKLANARVLSMPDTKAGADALPSMVLQSPDLAGRLELLPLLSGGQVLSLAAELYGGTLSGRVGQTGSGSVVDLVGQDIDLSLYPFDGESFSADVSGLLSLAIDLAVDAEEVEKSEGQVEIEIDGLALSELSVMGLSFDQSADFSEAVLKLEVSDGDAKVKKGSFESDLITLEIDGDVGLSSPLERSRLNLSVQIKLADELDNMAKLLPDFKRARDEDGTYHFKVSGSVQRPRFAEDRSKLRSSRSTGRSTSRAPTKRAPTRTTSRTARGDDGDKEGALERLRARRDDRRDRIRARDDGDRPDERGPDEDDEFEDDEFEDEPFEEPFEDEPFEDERRDAPPFEDEGPDGPPMPDEPYYEE